MIFGCELFRTLAAISLFLVCVVAQPARADEAAEKAAFEQAETLPSPSAASTTRARSWPRRRATAITRASTRIRAGWRASMKRPQADNRARRLSQDTGDASISRARAPSAGAHLAKLEDTDAARRHFEFVLGAADATAPTSIACARNLRLLTAPRTGALRGM